MRRCPGRAIGAPGSNGSPEACASRCRSVDAGRAGGLVEVDEPLLRGDEHRDRGRELRHRRPGEPAVDVAVRRLDRAGHADRRRARTANRRPGAAHPRTARLARWSGSASRPAPRSRSASATRAPCASATTCGSRAPRRSCPATPTRPTGAYEQAQVCLGDHRARARRGRRVARRRRAHAHLRHRRRASSTRSAARTARRSRRRAPRRPGIVTAAARPALAGRDRGRSGDTDRREADLPAVDHRQGRRRDRRRARRACSTTRSARATRTRSASRRSTCCSTPRRGISCSTSTRCSRPSRTASTRTASTPS